MNLSPQADRPRIDPVTWLPVRVWLLLAAAIPLVYFAVSLWCPPTINSDSVIGFLTWESMQAGAAWNHLRLADHADLTRDHDSFVSWWSPGQYLLCAPWQGLGLNLGQSVSLTVLLSEWLGLAGLWRLFRWLGCAGNVAAVAVFLVSAGWCMGHFYGMYWGGDVVLFGFTPWLLLVAVAARNSGALSALLFPLLFLFGTFLKLTFPVVALGLLLFWLVTRYGWVPRLDRARLRDAALFALSLAVSISLLYWIFLQYGETGFSRQSHNRTFSLAVSFAFDAPFLSAFSLGTFLDRIILYPLHPLVSSYEAVDPWLWLLVPFALWTYVLALRHAPTPLYRDLLASLLLALIGTFVWFYWRGSEVGFSDRYYRPAGFLLLPALIGAWRERDRVVRIFLGSLFAFSLAYGLASFLLRTHHLRQHASVGARGFSQPNITPPALVALDQINARLPAGSALVHVPTIELALEVTRQRRSSGHGLHDTAEDLARQLYHGRPGCVVVPLPDVFAADGRADRVLDSFVDLPHSQWHSYATGDWRFYYQGCDLPSLLGPSTANR